MSNYEGGSSKSGKIKMWKVEDAFESWYEIKVKKWIGWVTPMAIKMRPGGNLFYDKSKANKWFNYLTGNKKKLKTLVREF